MALEIENTKTYNHGFYIFTKLDDGPYLHTDVFYLKETAIFCQNGTLTLKIPRSACINLYNQVKDMEEKVSHLIRNLQHDVLNQLPIDMQFYIMQKEGDQSWECLRPNYFCNGVHADDPTLYLKGNLNTMNVYNLNGEPVPISKLGAGQYQFTLRFNMVYMGHHKQENHVANLQLRIVQLRYAPAPLHILPAPLPLPPQPPNSPATQPLKYDADDESSMLTQPGTPIESMNAQHFTTPVKKCPPAPKKPRMKKQSALKN